MSPRLGEQIREARKKSGKTLRGSAKSVNVSPALLSLIEQGRHMPGKDLIVELAKLYGADADRWCGMVCTITPEAEQSLARVAKEDPQFFRSMVNRLGGSHG